MPNQPTRLYLEDTSLPGDDRSENSDSINPKNPKDKAKSILKKETKFALALDALGGVESQRCLDKRLGGVANATEETMGVVEGKTRRGKGGMKRRGKGGKGRVGVRLGRSGGEGEGEGEGKGRLQNEAIMRQFALSNEQIWKKRSPGGVIMGGGEGGNGSDGEKVVINQSTSNMNASQTFHNHYNSNIYVDPTSNGNK